MRNTLIISRTTGAIVQSSGFSNPDQAALDGESRYSQTTTSEGDSAAGSQQAEKVAKAVFAFVKAADTCSQELSGDDDVRFLRLRLKRQELMIVPSKLDGPSEDTFH